jgi:sulfur relay (sulfurtransferase) DsrF/TusC family protein
MNFNNIITYIKQSLHKPQVWGFFVSMAIMAVVAVAFFAPDNFDGNVLAQHDMQQGAANGEEGRAYAEATGQKALWTNSLFSGMPTFQISPSYPSNSLFTWLNDIYGLFLPSPSNLLFMMMFGMLICCYCLKIRWWYALIAALAWGLSSYFIIIIGAGHIWKFLALTFVPPTVGALVLAYRGKYLWGGALMGLFAMLELNANHPQITYYSLFLLATLAIAYLVVAIRKHTVKAWLLGSAALLVGGLLALGANSPSLYNTYEYAKETKRAQSELVSKTSTTDESGDRPTGGLPKAEIGGWSNTPSESFSLLMPNVKGGATIRPEQGRNTLMSLDKLEAYDYDMQQDDIFGLIPQFSQYFGGKGMTNGPFYVGALICALFLLGCLIVKGPVKWSLLVMTVFSILLAMGNHFEALTDFMIYHFPMYNKFRAAETALVIASLCMPLLGALALQELFTREQALKVYRNQLAIAFGLPMFICLLGWLAPQVFGSAFSAEELEYFDSARAQLAQYPAEAQEAFKATLANIESLRYGLVSADASRSLIILLLGCGVVLLVAANKLNKAIGAAAVGVIVLVDLYNVDKRYVSTESFVEDSVTAVDPLAADAIDQEILKDKSYYRVADLTAFGDARRSFYHHMVGGYHAAKLNRYNDLIEHRMQTAISVGDYVDDVRNDSLIAKYPADQQKIMKRLRADYHVFDMLNTRYYITKTGLVMNADALGAAWFVNKISYVDNANAEMDALETLNPATEAVADKSFKAVLGETSAAQPDDKITLREYTPNKLVYAADTKNGGLAVFSEIYFPWGWHVTIDGNEAQLGRVNYVLRAVQVPAGQHTVVMTFNPESLHVTGTLAYISIVLIYLLLIGALIIECRRKPEEAK